MTMKRFNYVFPFLLVLLVGCADSAITRAEKTVMISYRACNSFVEFDHANRDLLKSKAPEIHKTAETIRTTAPTVFLTAWDSIALFRETKAEADKAKMESSVNDAGSLGNAAAAGLAQAKAVAAKQ